MIQASSQWSSSTSLAVGGSKEQVGQAGQYHTPAEQLLLGRQCPPSCRQHWWLPQLPTCLSQQQATPSSPRPWKKTVAGALYNSKYLHSHGLPSPALYFLPFLKSHRSAVSIIVQEISSLLAGSLTLMFAGSTVAAPLTSAAGPCIHPESSEDMARGEMGQSGTWPQSCLGLRQSFSQLQLIGTPIPWSTGQIRIPGDPTVCLCLFRANIQSRLTEFPACTRRRAHSGNSGLFQACDFFFVLQTKPRSLEMLLKGLLSIGDFFSQEEIC